MGFFVRSKKVKKNPPATPTKDRGRIPPQYRLPPPPPPPPPSTQLSQWHLGSPSHQPAPFQPAGLLLPPPGWNGAPQPPPPYQQPGPYPPIVVNQHHYYLGSPPYSQTSQPSHTVSTSLSKLNLGSAVDLAKEICQGTGIPMLLDDALPSWHGCGSQLVNQGNVLVNQISNHLDDVLTMIDQGCYNGREHDIFAWQPPPPTNPVVERPQPKANKKGHRKNHPKGQVTTGAAAVSGGFFAKVELYANSRLPMNLPPLKLYIPTYPLLCLAAQYSERVYEPPRGIERDAHVDADWRMGTKAMVIKSVPMDHMNTIVFAIRGTATFSDWAVNLNMAPTSPIGFLDDPGNLCHAGFLSVARKMISPVARRLRQLLEQDPSRASYSLLITGHSAGGAVAALLYSHMLAVTPSAASELNLVAGCFKRVHCITFGTPPVSLMPLAKPDDGGDERRGRQLRKSLFMSFVNEGDPVARADKGYVKSLLELLAAPAPRVAVPGGVVGGREGERARRGDKVPSKPSTMAAAMNQARSLGPVWKVPPCALSCAGRIVVLRSGDPRARLSRGKTKVEERLHEGVVAQIVTDEMLRGVVWGDPVAHMMRLYAGRIETLAVGAVTGRGY